MAPGSLLDRARRAWADLAGVPVGFPAGGGVQVVASPGSLLCPSGWVGVVTLGGAGIATVPSGDLVTRVSAALAGLPVEAVKQFPADHDDLAALLAAVTPEEVGETSLDEISSPVFALRDEAGLVAAAAGYRRWPGSVAHLSVLTAPQHRGRGLARIVASAAVEDVLRQGLLPQWRARPEPSRRVARALGFRELGSQLSFRTES